MDTSDPNTRLAPRWTGILKTSVGAGLCGIIAALAAMAVPNNSERAVLPLIFLAVVITLALRFGEGAGILGTLIAGGIFAYFLFAPVGSFRIGNEAAKTNLGWMLLVGISASFLLSPPSHKKPRRHRLDKEHHV